MSAAAFYGKMASVATKLITKFGTTITLVRTTGGSYNPVTGVTVPGTAANVTAIGLVRPYPDATIDGTRVIAGDRELLLDATTQPLPDDLPQIGGEDWTIVNIKTVKPDDATPVVYFVQVRK